MDLPYKCEYAKSGRSSCKSCKSPIGQGSLRLAVMVQAPHFDGKMANWFHPRCFFNKQRAKSTSDIENFHKLRSEDQKLIESNIGSGADVIVPTKKGKKRDASDAKATKLALKDYAIEYSKSSRATCCGCQIKIMKDEIRVSKKDYTTEVGMRFGGQALWHHVTCFAELRAELGYFESADKLPGFKSLKKDDQKNVLKNIPAIKQEDVPDVKKPKLEDDAESKKKAAEHKKQNKLFYDNRDKLIELKKVELQDLLNYNDQTIPVGVEEILDLVADLMAFGNLASCKQCGMHALRFNGHTYACYGNISEWTICKATIDEPERSNCKIPKELKDKYEFLKEYKCVPVTRVIVSRPKPAETIVKKEDEVDGPKIKRELPALYEMEFVILGRPQRGKDELKKQITKLGGKVTTKITKSVMAVFASPQDVENKGYRMQAVEDEDIHVVSEDFIDEAEKYRGKIPELVTKKSICSWGSDPNTRLPPEPVKSGVSKSKSMFTKSVPTKMKLQLKGGLAVDPESKLDFVSHIYCEGKDKYTVVLGLTDIQAATNKYYKLQLLESDARTRYWVFRSWGRIGTTIGGNKTEDMGSLHQAKREFCRLYKEKTGNEWENRDCFNKLPGFMYPIDVDYGTGELEGKLDIQDAPSNLSVPVQNLMKLIFDVKLMEKVMMEFELDMEKMPLGKLSKAQIEKAFKVLNELQVLIEQEEKNNLKLVDASNRFYTLIPHSFGVDNPPPIQDEELLKQKITMLENLMELEIAHTLMKQSGSEHTVDSYYKQLKADIEVLERETEEFKIIETYVQNTHAATHRSYELEIEDVYILRRHGEQKRYKPFKKLHNRKLLWHGSRTTNFAGIISQGLRIAPPEAPATGYMFGKGIYFADMVSKSANYCCTSPLYPKGLLLLSEVALGEMYELTNAEYIEKLPKGKHSTKGVGKTHPDPAASKIIEDGVEVPLGKGVEVKDVRSSLLYNEFIVYDVGQVNAKYLVKTNFKYKY